MHETHIVICIGPPLANLANFKASKVQNIQFLHMSHVNKKRYELQRLHSGQVNVNLLDLHCEL